MQFSPTHDRTIFIPAGPIGEEPAVEAVRQTGVQVESHVLEGWPHGFGVRGEWTTWFDNFLTEVMTNGASGATNSNKGIRTYLSSHSQTGRTAVAIYSFALISSCSVVLPKA